MTGAQPGEIREVPIRDDSIRLGQFLKLANLVGSGSDAKHLLLSGEILVNGSVETRRGRTLRRGDQVGYEGVTVQVGGAAEPDGSSPRSRCGARS